MTSYWLSALLCLLLVSGVCARDRQPPTITIQMPTQNTSYTTAASPLTVNGVAHDNERVTAVTWNTDRGASGVAQGTTAWSVNVPLQMGQNILTVTAHDAAGNRGTDRLTITLTTQPPPPGPITVQWSYTGGGDNFDMERCIISQPGCPMANVASIGIVDRQWVDSAVQPTERYCYRMAVVTQSTLGEYSNTMCSP